MRRFALVALLAAVSFPPRVAAVDVSLPPADTRNGASVIRLEAGISLAWKFRPDK